MTNQLVHLANGAAIELDRVVYLIFAIVFLVIIAVYAGYLLYVIVTRSGTCTFREGLKRSEESKNKQQLIAQLKNKLLTKQRAE